MTQSDRSNLRKLTFFLTLVRTYSVVPAKFSDTFPWSFTLSQLQASCVQNSFDVRKPNCQIKRQPLFVLLLISYPLFAGFRPRTTVYRRTVSRIQFGLTVTQSCFECGISALTGFRVPLLLHTVVLAVSTYRVLSVS